MSRPWFRFYGADYLTDLKTRNFTAAQHSCWLHLLCFACNSKTPGVIYDLTEETLMTYAGIKKDSEEWHATKGIFKLLDAMSMSRCRNGVVTILNWNRRQFESDSSVSRVRKYRDSKRQKSFREKVKRYTPVTVTPPETETEADTETDVTLITRSVMKESPKNFDKFWEKYPRKVGKQAAIRAWIKAKPPPLDKILGALEKQMQSEQWHKEGGSFIPHPTTWINQGRWDDEEVTSSRRVDKF